MTKYFNNKKKKEENSSNSHAKILEDEKGSVRVLVTKKKNYRTRGKKKFYKLTYEFG